MDLFSSLVGRPCLHIATETICLIKNTSWYKGRMDFHVLVPMKDDKGKIEFCDAVYSERELKLEF